jgi:hypothetical protein
VICVCEKQDDTESGITKTVLSQIPARDFYPSSHLSLWRLFSRPHAGVKGLRFATSARLSGLTLALGLITITYAPPLVQLS